MRGSGLGTWLLLHLDLALSPGFLLTEIHGSRRETKNEEDSIITFQMDTRRDSRFSLGPTPSNPPHVHIAPPLPSPPPPTLYSPVIIHLVNNHMLFHRSLKTEEHKKGLHAWEQGQEGHLLEWEGVVVSGWLSAAVAG